MNKLKKNIFTMRSQKIILILSMVALLTAITKGTYLEVLAKYINTAGMLYVLLIFPYYFLKLNDFDKITRHIVLAILVMTVIQTIRSFLYPDLQLAGNLYFTLFGNEYCMLSMIIPIFICLSQSERTLMTLKSITLIFCTIGVFCYFILDSPIYFSSWVATAFLPYYSKKQKIVVFIVYAIMFYGALFAEEAYRTNLVVLCVFVITLAYFIFKFSRQFLSLICCGMMIIPLIYLVITLLNPSYSIIQLIMEELSNNTNNSDFATDTRTFLFVEMVDDLNKNNAWFWGKGARAGYMSQYFWNLTSDGGDHWYRLTSEVGVLHYLLRGGLTFMMCFYGLIFYAVSKVLKYGRNKFVMSIAILASGWIFISCFSFLHGFNMTLVGFFMILGCCLSKKWLNKSDEEITQMFMS